jgi:tRNA U34 2-thiouridine synthase MnmA/TrmU
MANKAHGIGLLSGGLDSALAAKVVQEAGGEVTCLHFFTGFCVTGHNSRIGRRDRPVANHALKVAAEAGIPVELVDISDDYLPMVLAPSHGYGANMNPCVDCRVFMLDRARRYMEDVGADFVFTGEVIGQRPMSQMRHTIEMTEREAALEGRLLRPLSAKLLEPTIVEREGRIDRSKLHDFHGRSRKPQIELAERFGLTEYMQPAGGCCFLTDENYSRKLKDLIANDTVSAGLSMDDVYLLGVGRHFRLDAGLKIIVGRDETENNFLDYYTRSHPYAQAADHPGPTAIVLGEVGDGHVERVASVVARYCDGKREPRVRVEFHSDGQSRVVDVAPASDELVERLRI